MKAKLVPYFSVIYRFIRGAFATALAQTLAMQVDWTNPKQAFRSLLVSLVVGFLLALGKAIRDNYGGAKYNRVDDLDKYLPL